MWGVSKNGNYLPMAQMGIDSHKNPIREEGMYVEPVIAYRCWLVERQVAGPLWLRSWTKSIDWPIHKELEAACMWPRPGHPGDDHPCPNVHGCGIYGVTSLDQAKEWAVQSNKGIVGTVKMWGRIIVCEQGYLAQYAYPDSFILRGSTVSADHVRKLAEKYDVKVDSPE